MTLGKNLWRRIYVRMFVEEPAHVICKRPILWPPGCIERTRRLTVGLSYLLPACFALCNKRRKLALAPRNRDGLLVRAAIGLGDLTTPFGS